MKNLPEEEMFNELENRLREYAEKPDDGLWEKIAGQVTPAREPGWIAPTNRTALASSALLFMLLIYLSPGSGAKYPTTSAYSEIEQATTASVEKSTNESPIKETTETKTNESSPQLSGIDSQASESSNLPTHQRQAVAQENKKYFSKTPGSILRNSMTDKKEASDNADTKTTQISQLAARDNSSVGTTHDRDVSGNDKGAVNIASTSTQLTDSLTSDSLSTVVVSTEPIEEKKSPQPEKKKKKKPAFYVATLPSLSYHRMIPGKNDATVISKINSPSILSPQRLGINLEAGVQFPVTKKLEVFGGVFFYYQNQTLHYSYISDDNVIVEPTDGGYTVTPASTERKLNYTMLNAGAQTGFLYSIKKKGPLSHKVGAGIGYQHGLLQGTGSDTYFNSQSGYLSYQLFYRNEYALSKQARVFIQPTFSNTFWSDEKLDEPLSLKSYKAGITFGLIFTLD